jgi:hypothetical protein
VKLSGSELEERCDRAASRFYRKDYCEAAGLLPHWCSGVLDDAHIVTRGNRRLRYERNNRLTLCRAAHQFYTARPYAWEQFVKTYFPDKWAFVELHKNELQTAPLDYQGWLDYFAGRAHEPPKYRQNA